MVGPALLDKFHRALYERLAQDIDSRVNQLANGSAGSFDDYREQVGFIRALTRVLALCNEIESEMYSSSPREE